MEVKFCGFKFGKIYIIKERERAVFLGTTV